MLDTYVPATPAIKSGTDQQRDIVLGFWIGIFTMLLVNLVTHLFAQKNGVMVVNSEEEQQAKLVGKTTQRSGVVEPILKYISEQSLASSAAQGWTVLLPTVVEKAIVFITTHGKEEVDSPKYFEALEHLRHARTLFDGHSGGYHSFSTEIKRDYHESLDRATLLFSEG